MNKFSLGSKQALLNVAFLGSLISLSAILTSCTTMFTGRVEESETRYTQQVEEMKRKAEAKSKVVYAVHEIKEGAKIEAADIEERELENTKIPVDAITQSNLIEGRWAKYTIDAGSIISQHAILFRAPNKSKKVR